MRNKVELEGFVNAVRQVGNSQKAWLWFGKDKRTEASNTIDVWLPKGMTLEVNKGDKVLVRGFLTCNHYQDRVTPQIQAMHVEVAGDPPRLEDGDAPF